MTPSSPRRQRVGDALLALQSDRVRMVALVMELRERNLETKAQARLAVRLALQYLRLKRSIDDAALVLRD